MSITNEMTPAVEDNEGVAEGLAEPFDDDEMTPAAARKDPHDRAETSPVGAAHRGVPCSSSEEDELAAEVVDAEVVDITQWRTRENGYACDRCAGLKRPCTACKVEIAIALSKPLAMVVGG